jgi:hypothetical protein
VHGWAIATVVREWNQAVKVLRFYCSGADFTASAVQYSSKPGDVNIMSIMNLLRDRPALAERSKLRDPV